HSEGALGLPHPRIPLPHELYGKTRVNSQGIDLRNEHPLGSLSSALRAGSHVRWQARPLLGCPVEESISEAVINPAEHHDQVGQVQNATLRDVGNALQASLQAAPLWQATPPTERAAVLEQAANLLEDNIQTLMGLLVRE